MTLSSEAIFTFHEKILSWYEINQRDFPWRQTHDPYKILLSEVMSQQTQINRVVPKYLGWLETFPTIESLAVASPREVLALWSGLGYNRRALYLQKTAQAIVSQYGGKFPDDPDLLKKLPGIGDYTAQAVACFAFDKQIAVVDTNIRKIIAHEFCDGALPDEKTIKDIATQLLPQGNAYHWNQALMDYAGAVLKDKKIPIAKQSHFKTSNRYYRGQIIKLLLKFQKLSDQELWEKLEKGEDFTPERCASIITQLVKDGFLVQEHDLLRLV